MTKTSKTIIFFGTDSFSLESLKALHAADYKIGAIITKPDSRSGRGHKINHPIVKIFGSQHNIPVWQPDNLSDIRDKIDAIPGDKIGVLSSYGKIIPDSVIEAFSPGIINVHPSLLPKYRGASPIESAIENGDTETGVSIMLLTQAMDAGPIYSQNSCTINIDTDQPHLYKKLSELGAETLIATLPAIINGTITPKAQDESQATYCNILRKSDRWLNPTETPAITAKRKIQAHLSYPKTAYNITLPNNRQITIIILKAHITDCKKSILDVLCKDKSYLSIDKLLAPSGRILTRKDFENGYLS